MKVPDLIGYPGKQTRDGYNAGSDFSADYDKFVDDKLVVATLIPELPVIKGDANIYEFDNAWGDYVGDLKQLGIQPPKDSKIQIVISTLSPISRSYTNDYGDSQLLPKGNILGEGANEIMQLVGGDTEKLQQLLESKNGDKIAKGLGWSIDKYNKAINALKNGGQALAQQMGGMLGGAGKALVGAMTDLAKSPQSKIGWPKMWRDCSFQQSYQLNTRLYCFSTDNANDYDNNIKASIAALELFVTPKSKNGTLYTAPYMCEFDIPGMIHFPQAYIAEMTVIEGGNEGDFAQTGRPNVVDINMTIQSNYSISVNTPPGPDTTYKGRPSVRKDLIGLASGRNVGKSSLYMNGGGSSSDGSNISYEDALKKQDNATSESENYKNESSQTQKDRTVNDQLKDAATALANYK